MASERERPFKTCLDFPDAPDCCVSCHEDKDSFGMSMIELVDDQMHTTGEVCCRVHQWLEE